MAAGAVAAAAAAAAPERNGNGGRLFGRHGSHVQAGTRGDRGQDSKGLQHGALHKISGGYDCAAGEWFIEILSDHCSAIAGRRGSAPMR